MRANVHDPARSAPLSVPHLHPNTQPIDGSFTAFALVDRYPPYVCAGAELMLAAQMRHLVEQGHRAVVVTPVNERAVIDGVEIFPMDCAADLAEVSDVMIGHLAYTREAITTASNAKVPLVYCLHNDRQLDYWRITRDNLTAIVFNSQWMSDVHPAWRDNSIICRPPTQLRDYFLEREPPRDGFVTLVNPNPEKGAACFYEIAKRRHRDRFLIVEGGYGTQIRPPRGVGNVTRQPRTANMRDDVYARTRLLCVPSSYESWGRVATEALCFPGTAKIQADDIKRVFQRRYTGFLYRIETALGAVEATAGHPFWTGTWTAVEDITVGIPLWYPGTYAERYPSYDGPAGQLSSDVSDALDEGDLGSHRHPLRHAQRGAPQAGIEQEFGAAAHASSGTSDRLGSLLLRGTRRRRRDRDCAQADCSAQALCAAHHDLQYLGLAAYVDGRAPWLLPRDLDRSSHEPTTMAGLVGVGYEGSLVSAVLQSAERASRDQATADGLRDRVLRDTTGSRTIDAPERRAREAHLSHPRTQQARVVRVSRRWVVDEPVYNLETESHIYLADGILVHNCSGIPVIAHPTAGLKEALGPAGLFRDRDDPKSWCSLIDELGKRDVYRTWSARARERAEVLDAQSAQDLVEWERLLARCARVRREL